MPKKTYSKEDQSKIERLIAAMFINDKIGYCYRISKVVINRNNLHINPGLYASMATAVVRNTYRKIEEFVKDKCKKNIQPISNRQFYVIRSPLVQIREWLYQNELETFFKFVRLTYRLTGDANIGQEQANKLYGQLILTLQKQTKIDLRHAKMKGQGSNRKANVNYYVYRTFSEAHHDQHD